MDDVHIVAVVYDETKTLIGKLEQEDSDSGWIQLRDILFYEVVTSQAHPQPVVRFYAPAWGVPPRGTINNPGLALEVTEEMEKGYLGALRAIRDRGVQCKFSL